MANTIPKAMANTAVIVLIVFFMLKFSQQLLNISQVSRLFLFVQVAVVTFD